MSGHERPDERAARAWRAALISDDAADGPEIGPAAVRQRLRQRRRLGGVVAVGVTVVLVLAGVLVPRVVGSGFGDDVAAPGPVAPTPRPDPDGWRTEQYRSALFQVPEDWGYQMAPGTDWCIGEGDILAARYRKPYVSLGGPGIVRTIRCSPIYLPTRLWTEHVEAYSASAAREPTQMGLHQQDGWWVGVRRLGQHADRIVIKVVSRDRDLAERIVDSATTGKGACADSSPVQELGDRPSKAVRLSDFLRPDRVVICQYDTMDPESGGLRAQAQLTGAAAAGLVDALADGPPTRSTCRVEAAGDVPDVAVTLELWAGTRHGIVFINAAGCPDGNGSRGGVDDGTTVRALTRTSCHVLQTPPIRFWSAGGDVAQACLS